VAEDYFAAMSRVEQRLAIVPEPKQEPENEDKVVNVQEQSQILAWVERLALPELCQQERLEIAAQIKQSLSLGLPVQHPPPVVYA
jgi:hypothetical protein